MDEIRDEVYDDLIDEMNDDPDFIDELPAEVAEAEMINEIMDMVDEITPEPTRFEIAQEHAATKAAFYYLEQQECENCDYSELYWLKMSEMLHVMIEDGQNYTWQDGSVRLDPADILQERFDTVEFPEAATTFGLDVLSVPAVILVCKGESMVWAQNDLLTLFDFEDVY